MPIPWWRGRGGGAEAGVIPRQIEVHARVRHAEHTNRPHERAHLANGFYFMPLRAPQPWKTALAGFCRGLHGTILWRRDLERAADLHRCISPSASLCTDLTIHESQDAPSPLWSRGPSPPTGQRLSSNAKKTIKPRSPLYRW